MTQEFELAKWGHVYILFQDIFFGFAYQVKINTNRNKFPFLSLRHSFTVIFGMAE